MCESVFLLTLFKIVDMLLIVLKIGLPLLIIAKSSRDFFKPTITGNSDDIVKAGNSLLMRLLSAFFIFFLPTIVNIVMQMTVQNIDSNSADCLFNVTDVMIENAKVKAANTAIELASENPTLANYQNAKGKVDALEDGPTKEQLNGSVGIIENEINIAAEKAAAAAAAAVAAAENIKNIYTTNPDTNIKLDGTDEEILAYITNRYNDLLKTFTRQNDHPYYKSMCGGLVCDQLAYEGLITDADKVGAGCDQAGSFATKYNGKTSTGNKVVGYTMYLEDYDANCKQFEKMIDENGGTLENVVISFAAEQNQLSGPYGHVCLISKISNGKVYLIDNVMYTLGTPENPSKYHAVAISIEEFEKYWFGPFNAKYMAHIYR